MTNQEINEAVYEKLGGYDAHPHAYHGMGGLPMMPCPGKIECRMIPSYSTDIKAAWECFEKMAGIDEPFGLFEPYLFRDKLGDSTWVCGLKSSCGWVVRETADTAPMAICLAFLKISVPAR